MDETDNSGLEAAHERLSEQSAYQHDLPRVERPDIPPERVETDSGSNGFFDAIDVFFGALAPLFKILLIGALIALAGYVIYSLAKAFYDKREQMKALLAGKPGKKSTREIDIRPDETFAQNLLGDAEKLAADGQYGEAIHLMLLNSIQDMQKRIERKIGVSLTAREIGDLGQMPDGSRHALLSLISMVELNIFADQPMGETEFQQARVHYRNFAFGDKAA